MATLDDHRASSQPTCVIAGAGPRLGLAIARRYAREGFAPYMLLRRPMRLAGEAASLRARDLRVFLLECDVREAASIERAIRYIRERAGGCDVVVYNAFAPSSGRLTSLDPDRVLSDFQVNVVGAMVFAKLAIEEMRVRGGGTILFSGCGLANAPSAAKTSLSVSKAALRVLVDCLAEEAEPFGIRVGIVTVDGMIPADLPALDQVAELYWELFVSSEHNRRRELRFP
jgi:NAD(P)-dependent dehydrogenase (short-subunit alcohol dehydrogenase family)